MKKKLFEKNSRDKKSLKYFIVAFSIFILILAVASILLFMNSIDFDFGNVVENPDDETTSFTEVEELQYSVSELTGKSTILFVCTDDNNKLDFTFSVICDFDNKVMSVKCIDDKSALFYNGKSLTVGNVYAERSVIGLKSAFYESFDISADKYFVCDYSGAKEILSLFDGITVNVKNPVNYDSDDISLELDVGKQTISGAYTFNYLIISDDATREQIICDIISSVMVPEYIDNSQNLFASFVNSGDTDISVIDYSESIDNLKIYAYADDKFLPITSYERE